MMKSAFIILVTLLFSVFTYSKEGDSFLCSISKINQYKTSKENKLIKIVSVTPKLNADEPVYTKSIVKGHGYGGFGYVTKNEITYNLKYQELSPSEIVLSLSASGNNTVLSSGNFIGLVDSKNNISITCSKYEQCEN